jgi:hypothetical protein
MRVSPISLVPIESYSETTEKRQIVIDYCARYAVVPRKSDDPDLPAPWRGVSSEEIQVGIKEKFGVEVSKGMGTLTWEALGARGTENRGTVRVSGHDLEGPLVFLQERREEFLEAGLEQLAEWK